MTEENGVKNIVEATRAAIAADIAAAEAEEKAPSDNVEEAAEGENAEALQSEEAESAVAEESQADNDEEEELGGSPMIPRNRYNKAKQVAAEAERKAAIFEDRYNQLLSAFNAAATGGKPDAEDKEGGDIHVDEALKAAGIDPESVVDKEAIAAILKMMKGGEEEVKKASQSIEQQKFTLALQAEQARAEAKYPDFNDAYAHYVESIAGVIESEASERGHKYPRSAILNEAKRQLAAHVASRHAEGLNIADWIYNNAKRAGFGGTAKKGLNPDAIAKNRELTEKKIAPKTLPETGDSLSNEDFKKKYFKNGAFNVRLFQEDTNKIIKGLS